MRIPGFSFSKSYIESGPPLDFGLAAIESVHLEQAAERIEEAKRRVLKEIRGDDVAESMIRYFSRFFADNGFKCPLPFQLAQVKERGFPSVNVGVDCLLVCEMSKGILMGVQDLSRVEGEIVYDIASERDQYAGFRAPVACKRGEMVLRDERDIIASYFQGPDKRTAVTRDTNNFVVFGFSAPGVSFDKVEGALDMAVGLLETDRTKSAVQVFRYPKADN